MLIMLPFAIVYGLLLACVVLLVMLARQTYRMHQDTRKGLERIGSFFLHPRLHYHPGHTWMMQQHDGTVRVGLDDFGRRLVDGVRKVELPREGSTVVEGEVAVHLESGQRHAKVLSPVDGVVVGVNKALTERGKLPDDLEEDPYGAGWLFTVRVPDRKFARYPSGSGATKWMQGEIDRLAFMLHEELGVVAADGGDLIAKPSASLSDESWKKLTQAFFHAE